MPDALQRPENSIPPAVIDRIIQEIWDPLELKVTLTVATLGGHEWPVSEDDVLEFKPLRRGSRGDGSDRNTIERLHTALQAAVARGILVALRDDDGRLWYVVATDETRQQAYSGQFHRVDTTAPAPPPLSMDRPGIFGLYEQNIAVVTPIMADRLTEALNTYPEEWIRDAIGEAVTYNKRNWRYIQRILDNWATEGRTDETNRRDHEEHLDSEKYLRGKYAALFRRR